jgi:hypothetical protein
MCALPVFEISYATIATALDQMKYSMERARGAVGAVEKRHMQNIGHLVFSFCNGGCGEPWGKARRVLAADCVEVAYFPYFTWRRGEGRVREGFGNTNICG